ncbi:MAG: dienelactone hydrolase family protein [Parvularculaceae bacterium]|nr:dienelactone hydrolase family protein [Parvularculaceae bacterium]
MPPISDDIIRLYDRFTHGELDRRSFLESLARAAGGAAAASALLPVLANDYARAAIIAEDAPRLETFTAEFDTGDIVDEITPDAPAGAATSPAALPHAPVVAAYGARPKKESVLPAVVVIHENRGLNPHIKDVARRVALEGFQAFAVDMLSPYGGTPADEDAARALIGKLNRDKTAAKLAKVVEKLALLKTHQRMVGAVGFCWGGGMVNALAAAQPALKAGVVYYGRQASAEEAARIKAALLIHYAEKDERINAGAAAYEAALKAAGVKYKSYVYPGVEHAFNNDTNAARYNKEAADLAWKRTIKFFRRKLAF